MLRRGALLGFLCICAQAQSNLATVVGRVEDASHSPVSSAHITIRSQDTAAARSVAGNSDGIYEIANLPPGAWTVEANAPGFATFTRDVVLEAGQSLGLDIALAVSDKQDTVTVAATNEILKTQDVSLGEVVEPKSIGDLPLNGRMLIDLVLTVPGAHLGHGAQTGDMNPLYWRPGQRSAVTIGGNRPNANYFLLDGVTNTDPAFNTQNFSPSPDAVLEFQVQTGSYSAEMGGAGGGQINIVTRKGTQQFHGSVYEFLRNNALDARTWNEMPGTSHLVQNNYGAALGGPVFRNRTFFFTNYEAFRQTTAQTMADTVPTAQERGGDFSQSGLNLYDPSSSHANPNFNPSLPVSKSNPQVVRDPFLGNVIPLTAINRSALTMLQNYVPLPNAVDGMAVAGMTMLGTPTVFGSSGADSNNYLDVRDMRMMNDQGTVRLDQVLKNGDALAIRYSVSGEHGFMPQNLPGFGFNHDNF